jgi:hypothetical protein
MVEVADISHPRAAKDHYCCECDDPIKKGTRYEKYKSLCDGHWSTSRTCMSCVEIRNHFACDGWIFGQLWSDLEQNFFPDMKAGGPCMDGLSPAAKGRLYEKRLEWVFAQDEFEPCDRALPPSWEEARRAAIQRRADENARIAREHAAQFWAAVTNKE